MICNSLVIFQINTYLLYRNDQNVVAVAIDGADCAVDSVEDTQIICFTGEHKTTAKTPVTVTIGENGDALQVRLAYISLYVAVLI